MTYIVSNIWKKQKQKIFIKDVENFSNNFILSLRINNPQNNKISDILTLLFEVHYKLKGGKITPILCDFITLLRTW